jgi:hypothetical protein
VFIKNFSVIIWRVLAGRAIRFYSPQFLQMKFIFHTTIICGLFFLSSCTETKTVPSEKKTAILIFEEDSFSRNVVPHEWNNNFHLFFVDFESGNCKVFADSKLSSEFKLEENNTQLSGECDVDSLDWNKKMRIETDEYLPFIFNIDPRYKYVHLWSREAAIHIKYTNYPGCFE